MPPKDASRFSRKTLSSDAHLLGASPDEEARIAQHYGYGAETLMPRLLTSVEAIERVKSFLERNDVRVEVPQLKVRRSLNEISEFTTREADVLLSGTPFCIEVKGRPNLLFHEAEDFPYEDISVDTVFGYESKQRKPLAYVMVSGRGGGGIVLPTFTTGQWRRQRKRDHERGVEDDFYFAPKTLFKRRRKWLVSLCQALQRAPAESFDEALQAHGFPRDFIFQLYPK